MYPVQNLINAVTIGFSVGANAVISYHLGAQETRKANAKFEFSVAAQEKLKKKFETERKTWAKEKTALLSRAEQAEAALTERTAELSGLKRHVSQMVSAIFGKSFCKLLISFHPSCLISPTIAISSPDFIMQGPEAPISIRTC